MQEGRSSHAGPRQSRESSRHPVLILPWARRSHLASRVLAACLQHLSGAWTQVYGHPLVPAEIFVEMSRFGGT
ncbi:MAG: DUF4338 domain-containing protein [Deltaproteobacteria bacterium]|nr:MAG: DUF4338 domain-containing protein [Deltaproteobacteria bacterium]